MASGRKKKRLDADTLSLSLNTIPRQATDKRRREKRRKKTRGWVLTFCMTIWRQTFHVFCSNYLPTNLGWWLKEKNEPSWTVRANLQDAIKMRVRHISLKLDCRPPAKESFMINGIPGISGQSSFFVSLSLDDNNHRLNIHERVE